MKAKKILQCVQELCLLPDVILIKSGAEIVSLECGDKNGYHIDSGVINVDDLYLLIYDGLRPLFEKDYFFEVEAWLWRYGHQYMCIAIED